MTNGAFFKALELHPFKEDRHSLTAADAERREPQRDVAARHLLQQREDEPCTGRVQTLRLVMERA